MTSEAPTPVSGMRRILRFLKKLVLFGASTVLLIVALFALAVVTAPRPPKPHVPGPLAITSVQIVDTASGSLSAPQTVLVDGGRIVAIGEPGSVAIPDEAQRLDGSGRFLIPGLWDMHAHWATPAAPQLTMPLFLAHGVTGVREMGGMLPLEQKRQWQDQLASGDLVGPRVVGQAVAFANRVESVDEVREMVALAERPREFVKIYTRLLPEFLDALSKEARAQGVDIAGHRPQAISTEDAARAGMRSIEHARLFVYEAFPGADDLRERTRARNAGQDDAGGPLIDTALRRRMVDENDPESLQQLAAVMVEHDVWFCPTHLTRKMDAFADDPEYRNDPRLRYIHTVQRWLWADDADGMVDNDPSPEGRQAYMDVYTLGLTLTGEAHRAGVRVLAGTDANDTYVFPGFSLHDELKELAQAGLTPAEVLYAATVAPAEFAGMSQDHGTVEVGKMADLVLLEGNPLANISHTQKIHTVVFGGAVYERDVLDGMLERVESNASSWRLVASSMWGLLMG